MVKLFMAEATLLFLLSLDKHPVSYGRSATAFALVAIGAE